jgi:membrane fusion protein YbhG
MPQPETTNNAKTDAPNPAATQDQTQQPPAKGRPKVLLAAVIILLLGAAAYFVWKAFFSGPSLPSSVVALSGRIEGDDSAISPKTTGRILEIRFREGDSVQAGDIIAVLSDEQIQAREDQAKAAVAVAQAKAKAAQDQISVLEQQLEQNQIQTAQATTDAQGLVRQAEAQLTTAQAELAQQQAAYQIAAFDRDAYTRLAKTGAASERQAKQATSTAEQAEASVTAAQRRVQAAQGALQAARANLQNPPIREAQVAIVRRQIVQQQSEVASAQAATRQAQGQLMEAEANRNDLIVEAPFSGVIATRAAEPGEVVTAGTTLVTMVDLHKVYLRGFVPEGQIGKVKLEQSAHIYLDSNPKQAIDAYVSRIDPQATFTPENTYFQNERVKEVVGVKLQLKGAYGYAKPGMPADGEILTEGSAWPEAALRK